MQTMLRGLGIIFQSRTRAEVLIDRRESWRVNECLVVRLACGSSSAVIVRVTQGTVTASGLVGRRQQIPPGRMKHT